MPIYSQQPSGLTASTEDVYNLLMYAIEPDLTTFMLPTLEEKYKNETAEQKTERTAKYSAAFLKVKEAMHTYYAHQKNQVLRIKNAAFSRAKSADELQTEHLLEDLESQINI